MTATEERSTQARTRLYVGLLALTLIAILLAFGREPLSGDLHPFLIFTALYFATESALIFFHHDTGRVGLSAAEAVFMPMLVALTLDQVVWSVAVGALVVSVLQRRFGGIKAVFNVAQFGIAAALGAGVYGLLADPDVMFSVRNAGAALTGVLIFALMTHLFVSAAIALAEGKSFWVLSGGIARETVINFAVNVCIGLLFAASYAGAEWTAVFFPLPLAALYFGYRAILRQEGERERIEKLHEATRALASRASAPEAIGLFLVAVENIVSAREIVLLVNLGGETRVARSIDGSHAFDEDEPPVMLVDFARHLERTREPVVVAEGEASPWRNWADDLGAKSLVATPLQDESIGCLVAIDRVGAGEFSDDDAKLLEALAQELVLSLGSYRLFAQVSQERERFGRIFSGSKDGIALLDDEGRVQAWNPALESITGYTQDDVVGRQLSDTLLIRDAGKQRLDTWEFVGADPDVELEVVTREGPGRFVSVMSGSVSRGKETSWVLLVRDRTAEHQTEQSKSDFLSTISHELRTPLTSIKGSLQVLARGQDALPEGVHTQMVEVLQRSSDRLERLLLNLLFVSRVETDGQLSIVPQEVDLESIVRGSVRAILGGHDPVELIIEPDSEALVNAEVEGLTQAVEHLLDNARKFGPRGKITVELRRASRFAELIVSDEGPGIPKAEHDRIFERFVRLGDTLTRETQGPGVGLFIVRSVAAAVGGRVWVESEGSEGSKFHLLVPLSRKLRVAPQPAAGAS